jgi:hypothetical protein
MTIHTHYNPSCQIRRRKPEHLGEEHPASFHFLDFLTKLYEAWNKPEKAEEWRAKLPQKGAVEE